MSRPNYTKKTTSVYLVVSPQKKVPRRAVCFSGFEPALAGWESTYWFSLTLSGYRIPSRAQLPFL
jgi:hypothetical protein